jgi:PGF-pre-PGF domain-containing protein
MKLVSIMLVSLLLFVGMAAAGEIRSPVCPVSFGSAPCIINITNSPSLLSDYERVYIDTSNGYYLTGSNFYYAGMNYQNSQIDLFSRRYNITSINTGEAILTSELYKNDDSLQIVIGKELILKNGYTLELVDVGEDGAVFSLKRNNEILETSAVNRNKIFSYNITIDGKEVEIFRTTLTGIFGSNSAVITGTCLRDTKTIRNGDSFGDYEINLKDLDGNGNVDIVYSLKNKTIDLPDKGVTPVLDNFLTLRTYPAYVPFYESLGMFNLTGEDSNFRIYSINNNLKMSVPSFLSSPPDGSIIAADSPVGISAKPAVTYKDSNSIINELRGDNTFYIYTKGNLSLSVTKQDLNWYSDSDALDIKIYSSTNKLVKSITIPDDGNLGNNGHRGYLQTGILEAILDEGVYKVTMTGGADLLIRSIKLNNGNIVVQNPFLAGALYTSNTKFNLYTRAVKGDRLKFLTYHAGNFQILNVTGGGYAQFVNISAINTPFYIDLPPSNEFYKIEVPKGDIIITANSYFSFSSDSYFSTSAAKILPLQNSMDWLKKNKVDYVIIPSSNPFTGLYFFKPKTDKEYYVRSPKSPWTDYTIDTWSAPNIFYFNPAENNTWEYLVINNSGTNNLNKDRLEYVAVQTQGNIGYLGELYKVLDVTLPEMTLSKKVSDIDNKTLLLNREWQVGGKYTLALKDVDSEGKYAVLELSRLNKPVSRQIISKGSTMFYNISFKGKDVPIFQNKLTDVFHGANTSVVKISDIELYDENMTVIKSGTSVNDETLTLSDVNNDGLPDIVVTRDSAVKIEKSTRKTLFNSYLDLVVDDGGTFYLERKVTSPSAVTNSSNIARESSYTLAPYFPGNNITLTFPDFDITSISIDASAPINQVKVSLKELKNKPDDVIVVPDGSVYKYFSISIDEDNLKNATVYFRVNCSWLTGNNISNASVALLEFHDGAWDVIPTYVTGSDGKFAYYSAKASDISALFAISGGISIDQALASQAQADIASQAIPDAKQASLLEEYKQSDITATPLAQAKTSENPMSNLNLILLAFSSISAVTSGYFITRRFNVLNNKTISYLSGLCSELFNSLLLTFLLLLLIDNIWDNSVTRNLNLNYLMVIVFSFGIISLYSNRTETGEITAATKKEYITTAGIGILGMIIIWSKINYMGFISYPIAIISGILIVLLSFLMLEDNNVLN